MSKVKERDTGSTQILKENKRKNKRVMNTSENLQKDFIKSCLKDFCSFFIKVCKYEWFTLKYQVEYCVQNID